jgi:hypothetical protein
MPYIENFDFGQIGEWATGADDHDSNAKTFLVLRPFEGVLTCSILIT